MMISNFVDEITWKEAFTNPTVTCETLLKFSPVSVTIDPFGPSEGDTVCMEGTGQPDGGNVCRIPQQPNQFENSLENSLENPLKNDAII
jgi:hypothetical protein